MANGIYNAGATVYNPAAFTTSVGNNFSSGFGLNTWTGGGASSAAPKMASSGGSSMSAMGQMGVGMAIMGAIQSGIGTFYAAKSAKNQLKSQAMTFDYQKQMSALNARAMEDAAQQIMRAGEQDIGRLTLRAGQVMASSKVAQAARGGQIGTGSNAEELASLELMTQTDALTINSNTVRAAWAARTQAQNYEAQAAMAGVSAFGARSAASQISPFGQASTNLMSSGGNVASAWYNLEMSKRYMGGMFMPQN
jgi:hypothetical protein